jgi:hypothetical protein
MEQQNNFQRSALLFIVAPRTIHFLRRGALLKPNAAAF